MKKVLKIIGIIWATFWLLGAIAMLTAEDSVVPVIVFLFFAIVGIIPIIAWKTPADQKNKKPIISLTQQLSEEGFIVNKSVVIPGGTFKKHKFLVDDQNKKFAVNANSLRIFSFSDLGDYELNEDGNSLQQGKGLATAVGGLTFGLLGAIVGSSGKRKQLNTCTSLVVRLMVHDLDNPQVVIPYITTELDKNGSAYKATMEEAKNLMAILSYISNQAV